MHGQGKKTNPVLVSVLRIIMNPKWCFWWQHRSAPTGRCTGALPECCCWDTAPADACLDAGCCAEPCHVVPPAPVLLRGDGIHYCADKQPPQPSWFIGERGENPHKINSGNACVLCQRHQIIPVSKAASGLHSSASVLINIFMEGNFSQGGICLIIIIYLEIAQPSSQL